MKATSPAGDRGRVVVVMLLCIAIYSHYESMRGASSSNNVVYGCCRYHVIFCPKYRRKVLTPPIDERLKGILAEQSERWGQERIEVEVIPDHVHLLVGGGPQVGIHRLVKLLKGPASHTLREEFPVVKRRLPSLGTTSYCVATVGAVTRETRETLKTLKRSVENQKGR
jgi:REP-associated tyrosine transposase